MYVAESKRLTHEGARKIMATAVDLASQAGIAISCAVVDAGGHMILFERMDGGRFHTVHSSTTKAVCAASNRRPTTAKGTARASAPHLSLFPEDTPLMRHDQSTANRLSLGGWDVALRICVAERGSAHGHGREGANGTLSLQ